MGWTENFSLVMRSSFTALRNTVEDPERMLHQLLIDMEEEHASVRDSVAGAIADELLLHKRLNQARDKKAHWLERAEKAMRGGDESRSRSALQQADHHDRAADGLAAEYRQQKAQTTDLQRSVAELDDKIRQARLKQTVLVARLARANSERVVDAALTTVNSKSAFAQFGRLEKQVDRAEAINQAYRRLNEDTGVGDEQAVAAEFAEEERKERLEQEFELLRSRVFGAEDPAS